MRARWRKERGSDDDADDERHLGESITFQFPATENDPHSATDEHNTTNPLPDIAGDASGSTVRENGIHEEIPKKSSNGEHKKRQVSADTPKAGASPSSSSTQPQSYGSQLKVVLRPFDRTPTAPNLLPPRNPALIPFNAPFLQHIMPQVVASSPPPIVCPSLQPALQMIAVPMSLPLSSASSCLPSPSTPAPPLPSRSLSSKLDSYAQPLAPSHHRSEALPQRKDPDWDNSWESLWGDRTRAHPKTPSQSLGQALSRLPEDERHIAIPHKTQPKVYGANAAGGAPKSHKDDKAQLPPDPFVVRDSFSQSAAYSRPSHPSPAPRPLLTPPPTPAPPLPSPSPSSRGFWEDSPALRSYMAHHREASTKADAPKRRAGVDDTFEVPTVELHGSHGSVRSEAMTRHAPIETPKPIPILIGEDSSEDSNEEESANKREVPRHQKSHRKARHEGHVCHRKKRARSSSTELAARERALRAKLQRLRPR